MSTNNNNPHNRKFTSVTSPIGQVGFASTFKEGRFGGYTLDLFLNNDEADVQSFLSELQAIHSANIEHETTANNAKGTDQGFTLGEVKDSDPSQFQDGNYTVLRLKKKSRNQANELLPSVAMYDSSGESVTLNHEIPIGSSVRARITFGSYEMAGKLGTSRYLTAIQIAELAKNPKASKPAVFDSVDGGFVGVGKLTEDIGTE